MPAGKFLVCELDPLGITGPQRAVLFLGPATAEGVPDQMFDL